MKSEEDETLEDNTIFESYEWRNWNDAWMQGKRNA